MKIGRYSGGVPNEALFAAYRESGIEVMELSVGNKQEIHDSLPLADIQKWAGEYGIELWSYHLPFGWYNIATLDSAKRSKVIDLYAEMIKKAREIGVRRFVTHPSAEPYTPEERADRIAACKESLVKLAEIGRQNDAIIAVEDLPRTCLGNCSAELLDLVSVDDDLGICCDTNHLLGEDLIEFISKVVHRVVTTHISDYDFIDERHWLPGEGKVDWQAVYKTLTEGGYKGPWLYELGFGTPTKTLHRPRDLKCSDYVRNAKEIFEGKPITVIGTPRPGLGMNVW